MKTVLVINVGSRAVGIPAGETMYPLGVTLAPGDGVEIDLSKEGLKTVKGMADVELSDVDRPAGGGDTPPTE